MKRVIVAVAGVQRHELVDALRAYGLSDCDTLVNQQSDFDGYLYVLLPDVMSEFFVEWLDQIEVRHIEGEALRGHMVLAYITAVRQQFDLFWTTIIVM